MGNGPDIGSVPQVVLGDGKKMHARDSSVFRMGSC